MIDYLTSRNRVEKSSCTFVVTWFMTKASLHFSGEVVVFSISGTGAIKYLHKEKEKRELWVLPHIYAKINSRWIIDVTIKYKTIGFIEVNTGETINGLQLGDDSFDTTPKAPFMKKKNSWKKNWTSVKLQTSALPIWAADETWTILMATRERQLPSPDLNLTFEEGNKFQELTYWHISESGQERESFPISVGNEIIRITKKAQHGGCFYNQESQPQIYPHPCFAALCTRLPATWQQGWKAATESPELTNLVKRRSF